VTLLKGEHGVAPDDTNRVAYFAWNPTEFPVEPGALTGVWARQFTVPPAQAFGRWAWQDAPATPPREDDARELVALCEIVHAALARRDLDAHLRAALVGYDGLRFPVDEEGEVSMELLTRDGRARVINVELLSQQLLIATQDNRRILITPEECLSVIKRGAELP
jgi:hypothetical protein